MSKEELEKLAVLSHVKEPYPFLLANDEIVTNGQHYYMVDAGNEVFKEMMAVKDASVERAVERGSINAPDTALKESGARPHRGEGEKKKHIENSISQSRLASRVLNMDQLFHGVEQGR